jgi:hypothetical protein
MNTTTQNPIKALFVQTIVFKGGGSYTTTGKTLQECKEKARAASNRMSGEIFAMTIPYLAISKGNTNNDYIDATLPSSWRKLLGKQFCALYGSSEDNANPPSNAAIEDLKATVKAFQAKERLAIAKFKAKMERDGFNVKSEEPPTIDNVAIDGYTNSLMLMIASIAVLLFSIVLFAISVATSNQTLNLFAGCGFICVVCGIATAGVRYVFEDR